MKFESIIFDLDGTLWDSSDSVAASWVQTVHSAADPLLKGLSLTKDTFHSVMGMPMDEIGEKLFPMLSVTRRNELMEQCSADENDYVAAHGGLLYDITGDILAALSAEHRLFIVSNCQCGYIEAFFEYSGYQRYFTDYLCWGDTRKPKNETIRRLMDKNKCVSAVYVGDTQGDCTAAFKAGIPFIHAAYGFGQITTPDRVLDTVNSLSELSDKC